MAMTTKRATSPRRSANIRRSIRHVTAALCALVGVLYPVLLVLVPTPRRFPE